MDQSSRVEIRPAAFPVPPHPRCQPPLRTARGNLPPRIGHLLQRGAFPQTSKPRKVDQSSRAESRPAAFSVSPLQVGGFRLRSVRSPGAVPSSSQLQA